MVDVTIRQLDPGEASRLPPELALRAGFCGLDAWSGFVRSVYPFPVYRLVAERGGNQEGLLALTHVRHPAFGNYLTTAPFASYGGFLAASPEARTGLFSEANRLAQSLGVDYVLARYEEGGESPPEGWVQYSGYATYRIGLPAKADALLPS